MIKNESITDSSNLNEEWDHYPSEVSAPPKKDQLAVPANKDQRVTTKRTVKFAPQENENEPEEVKMDFEEEEGDGNDDSFEFDLPK